MMLYASLIMLVGLWATVLSWSNRSEMQKQKQGPPFAQNPLVTIAIPARNEEQYIHDCVSSLINQSYRNIEILILDDNSTDNTANEVARLQTEDSRVSIITGKSLQPGWRGKLFAMQQLYEQSHGQYILFTDADTVHHTDSVKQGLTLLHNEKASMVSGYPSQVGGTFWTQVIVSAMLLNTVLFTPLRLQKKIQWPPFSMAIGQYLLLKREVLDTIGGFTTMSDVICDDVMLARACTRAGHKYIFADMKDALSCSMFPTFKTAFLGLERSIIGTLTIKNYLMPLIVVALAVLTLTALAPVASVIMAVLYFSGMQTSLLALLFTIGGTLLLFGSWTITGRYHGFPKRVAMKGPFVLLMIVFMYLHGYYRKVSKKGFLWKGRIIS